MKFFNALPDPLNGYVRTNNPPLTSSLDSALVTEFLLIFTCRRKEHGTSLGAPGNWILSLGCGHRHDVLETGLENHRNGLENHRRGIENDHYLDEIG